MRRNQHEISGDCLIGRSFTTNTVLLLLPLQPARSSINKATESISNLSILEIELVLQHIMTCVLRNIRDLLLLTMRDLLVLNMGDRVLLITSYLVLIRKRESKSTNSEGSGPRRFVLVNRMDLRILKRSHLVNLNNGDLFKIKVCKLVKLNM